METQVKQAFQMPEDGMQLFKKGQPNGKKIVDLLEYKKREIAQASGVKSQLIRYDDKIPKELKERLFEWAYAINLVNEYFKNPEKTMIWFKTPNVLLGESTPRDMIRMGKSKRLIKFVRNALDENKAPD